MPGVNVVAIQLLSNHKEPILTTGMETALSRRRVGGAAGVGWVSGASTVPTLGPLRIWTEEHSSGLDSITRCLLCCTARCLLCLVTALGPEFLPPTGIFLVINSG